MESYAERQRLFFSEKLIYGDSFSRAIRRLGHECEEVVYDVTWLQTAWARERSKTYSGKNREMECLIDQIKEYKPEILFFQHAPPFAIGLLQQLKSICPSIKKIAVHRAFPGDLALLSHVDLLMVGTRRLLDDYRSNGLSAQLVYHYFDEDVVRIVKSQAKKYPVTFLGSSGFGYGAGHATRYWTLKTLLQKTPIKMWLEEPCRSGQSRSKFSGLTDKIKGYTRYYLYSVLSLLPRITVSTIFDNRFTPLKVKSLCQEVLGRSRSADWRNLLPEGLKEPDRPLVDLYPSRCHAPIFGIDFYNTLSESKISFNCHTDAAFGQVGNIRMFQATGVGSCLLSDTGSNMADLFVEDSEVVTYKCVDEAIEKVSYLLSHPSVLDEIAKAGQKRTLKDHTASARCEQISELFSKIMRSP